MKYQYDLIVIGLGPAGMAAAIMAHNMGLKVCAIEKSYIGGECLNVGCIPSKALLRLAKHKHIIETANLHILTNNATANKFQQPLQQIGQAINNIRDHKTAGLLADLEIIKATGYFIDQHTVQAGDRKISAQKIFIALGTKAFIPNIPGLSNIPYLTNENFFNQQKLPASLLILGGGAIGVEMAQACARLGVTCTIVHADPRLITPGDPEASALLEDVLKQDNIAVYNNQSITAAGLVDNQIVLTLEDQSQLQAEQILIAAGRVPALGSLQLVNAGIILDQRGFIKVNKKLQTSVPNIYAVGDCNGHMLFSHAAMHQSMLALFNTLSIWPVGWNFKKYVVPWTIFTDPNYASVGMTEQQLIAAKIKYITLKAEYQDYGAAIAEGVNLGFVKVFASKCGRVYGAVIIGEGAGDLIQQWAYIIQYKLKLCRVLLLQHSFPTMSFLNKRIAEIWVMQKMQKNWLKQICRWLFRL